MKINSQRLRKNYANKPELNNVLSNIAWLFIDKILRMGVGLLVGVWIARYLGPEKFGQLNYATAITGLLGSIAALGLPGIVVRDIVRKPETANQTIGTAAVLQLIGSLVAYILILTVIGYLRPNDTIARTITAILGATVLFKASEVVVYWFEAKVQSKFTVWVQNSAFVVFAIIKVLLIYNKAPVMYFIWAMLGEAIVVAVVLLWVMHAYGISLVLLSVSVERAKELLKDSWPLILSGISIMIYMRIDQIMLGQMIGVEAAGIYSAATRISEVWYFIPMAIVASMFPNIIEAKKNNEQEYYRRLQRLYDLMAGISVVASLLITLVATPVIRMLYGEAYLEAGLVLSIHIWASVFVFLGVAGEKWFLAENMQKIALQRSIVGAVSSVVLNLVLIPRYGVVGAAISLVISQGIAAWLYDAINKSTRIIFKMKLAALNPRSWISMIAYYYKKG